MGYVLNNQSKDNRTEIIIGPEALGGLAALAAGYSKLAIITDENSAKYCLDKAKKSLPAEAETIILPSGEGNKSLELVETILRRLRETGFDRKSLIIGLGGGVINDIAGFAASTYMRGIDWIMLPTTLTAQADASIGGKTGVNMGGYKNMVGSFWPPKAVLINPRFLDTLPERHLKNGLAEIIKMGVIYDQKILDCVAEINPAGILGKALDKASELSVKAKAEVVNNDMYESGERKLLNFGHTIGHAVEAISMESGSPLLHGEAISVGMVGETRLAELEKVCEAGLADEIAVLLRKFGLPTSYKGPGLEDIVNRISSDKKNVGENTYWTLPKSKGQGVYNHIAEQKNVEKAISSVIN